ncbi:alpha/beta fold hydrolase [Alkalibacterium sp. 20]|uniref:alpha/beta fold hydrolase n=1 Tax=Alkalibacterium sp. 20 TaxID=1798803 RepID=UPI0008FFF214|nr:alpha/beta fold hydrolase [Alkalibacterium sp. 20]OJF95943.1 esterase [Alkalibacterium sp. 20]
MKLTIRQRTLGTIPLLEVVDERRRNDVLPLIVYYHGWQSAKELVLTQGRLLAEAGFRVLLPDAVNHGDRYQPITKIPSLTFWQSIQTNLFEFGYIVNHFKKLGVVDDRIAVGGVSMGGITTCALLTHHPEIQAAACVMGSPQPVNYRTRLLEHAAKLDRFFPEDYESLLAWVPKYDLSHHPDTLGERPLLFWHGIHDLVVPYDHVVEFVKENPGANLTFIEEDEEHLVRVPTMKQITEFYKREMIEKSQ